MRFRAVSLCVVLTTIVLAFAPAPLRADDSDVVGEFGIFTGLSRADQDLVGPNQTPDGSPLFGLRWAAMLNPRWNWFADADYMQHDTPLTDDSDIFEIRTGMEALFPISPKVNWFLSGAVGGTDVNYPKGIDDFSRPLLSFGIGLAKNHGGFRGELRAEELLGDNGIHGANVTNFQLLVGYSFGLKRREEQGAHKPLFTKEQKKLTLEGINFEFNSARLTQDSYRTLDHVAGSLRAYPKVRVEIGGHTDEMGTPEYNMELSRQRAETVRDYLMSKGISGSRLEAKGYGETEPIAPNQSEEGRAKNRRVELKQLEP